MRNAQQLSSCWLHCAPLGCRSRCRSSSRGNQGVRNPVSSQLPPGAPILVNKTPTPFVISIEGQDRHLKQQMPPYDAMKHKLQANKQSESGWERADCERTLTVTLTETPLRAGGRNHTRSLSNIFRAHTK